jgi:hypothetical protein
MTLKLRLGRLEKRARPVVDRGGWTPRRFLQVFEELGSQGYFACEPDYETAIRELRREVESDDSDCMSLL